MRHIPFSLAGRLAVLLLFGCAIPALNGPALNGQDANAAKDEKAAVEKAAVEKPDGKAAPSEAAAAFNKKMEEWKGMLKGLRDLRAAFDKAPQDEVGKIREKWKADVAAVEAFIPSLREAAIAAYAAAPKEDRQVLRLLSQLLGDAAARDQFEVAAKISDLLIETDSGEKTAYDFGGVAAFVLNDFDKAEKYLKEADAIGAISNNGKKYQSEVATYRDLWKKEEELRKKEAEANDLPRVKITTNKGGMIAELFENEAPETVGNFVSLVEKGFYNGLTFHRVLPGFMAQGGCPKGDGTEGPGYKIYCECEKPNHREHFRGSLSMAHAGKDTGGSQFFLTFVPTSHLNGRHTVFGRIIEGLDVLERLQRIDPMEKGDKPLPDKILKAEVIRKRDHDYAPNKVQ